MHAAARSPDPDLPGTARHGRLARDVVERWAAARPNVELHMLDDDHQLLAIARLHLGDGRYRADDSSRPSAIVDRMEGIIPAWGRILQGYRPALSVEITRECPLRCPGCYAYGDEHLGGDVTLRQVSDYKGQELVDRFFAARRRAPPAARLDRRRRAARALPRAERDPAAAGRARHLHAARHERRAADPDRVGATARGCRSSCRSTACSPSTTCGARRRPTTAS